MPAFGNQKQEDQKVKAISGYIESPRPVWIHKTLPQKQKNPPQNKTKQNNFFQTQNIEAIQKEL